MLDLLILREPTIVDTTFGDLYVGGDWFCFTLEDTIREVPGKPVSEWKIHGATAIPEGRYRVTLEWSPKFERNLLTVNDVHGFTGIRIHALNDDSETEGCIGVGFQKLVDPRGDGGNILQSRDALKAIEDRVIPVLARDEVWLTIHNP